MPRTCSRVIALSAMVVALSTAQAAEPETLTLACEGTVTDVGDGKSGPIAVVIIVNFKTRTVQGLGTSAANGPVIGMSACQPKNPKNVALPPPSAVFKKPVN